MKNMIVLIVDLYRRNRFHLRAALVTGLTVFLITLVMPNKYKATVSVLPSGVLGKGGKNGLAAAASVIGISMGGMSDADDSYQDILESRVMGEKLMSKTFEYGEKYFIWEKPKRVQKTLYQYLDEDNRDYAFKALSGVININRDFKTKLLTVNVQTRSPELSQAIAQAMLKELDDFVNSVNDSMDSEKIKYANSQLVEAQVSLGKAESKFKAFLFNNRNYSVTGDPEIHLKGIDLENEVTFWQQLVTQVKLSREQAISDAKERIPKVAILDTGTLPINKNQPKRILFTVAGCILGWLGSWYLRNRAGVHKWVVDAYAGKGIEV